MKRRNLWELDGIERELSEAAGSCWEDSYKEAHGGYLCHPSRKAWVGRLQIHDNGEIEINLEGLTETQAGAVLRVLRALAVRGTTP